MKYVLVGLKLFIWLYLCFDDHVFFIKFLGQEVYFSQGDDKSAYYAKQQSKPEIEVPND